MRHIRLTQGSPDWLAHRRTTRNASDAPAVLDCSPYKKRSELVRELATGIGQDFSPEQQAILNSGHVFEALARPLAEDIVGQELYPVVGVHDDGVYGASFDGLTMLEDVAFEHKRLNAALRDAMTLGCTGADLPLGYQVQMEHQALTCPTVERTLFMASDWRRNADTGEWELVEERHCWYTPNPALRAQILAGWEQLEKDVAAYVPPAAAAAAPVGRAPDALPALRIEVTGAVTASNLAEFRSTALAAIQGVNRELKTDADFADAEASVKWCADVESRIAAAKDHALSQTQSIEELFRTMDDITAEARRVRLELDRLVKARKEQIRGEIAAEGVAALRTHVAALNTRLGQAYMPTVHADFGGVIKGKRTVASLRDAVSTELARAKIAANEVADRIQANMQALAAAGEAAQFPDAAQLVLKAPDDLAAIIANRVAEAERRAQKAVDEALERQRLIDAEKDAQQGIAEARAADALPAPLLDALSDLAADVKNDAVAGIDAQTAIGAAQASAATVGGDTITLGRINALLAPIKLDAAGLEAMGFEVTRVKAAAHFPATMFPMLCRAVAKRATDAATAGVGAAEAA